MPTLPEFNLDGKVAIVTGAAQGIGKGIAKSLAQAGANVVLAGISLGDRENDDAAMQSAAEEIKQVGNKVLPITADMRVLEDVENLIDQTLNAFGGNASPPNVLKLHRECICFECIFPECILNAF